MNRLSHSFHRGKTKNRDRILLIDGRPLVDLLEEAVPRHSPEPGWVEKHHAVVVAKALKQTLRRGGEFCILTCAECKVPEDLTLEPFVVEHAGDEIVWRVKPPGADHLYKEYSMLEFRFNRAEYEQAVRRFLQRITDETS